MGFWKYVLADRRSNFVALWLLVGFAAYYALNNYPFLAYMERHAALLAAHSPFYGAPFTLNLFNFDPSMYYGFGNTSIIHPFYHFLSGALAYAAQHTVGNLFFLAVQSVVNALSVAMVYYYLRRSGASGIVSLLFAILFGLSSYHMFTSLIPDSYPYAQLVLVLSVLYLQYARTQAATAATPPALLTLLNFGITSTNAVPFAVSLFVNMREQEWRSRIARFAVVMLYAVLAIALLTVLQLLLLNGQSWISNWMNSLNNGGFSYVAPFWFERHWKAVYMLAISPVLTPEVAMIDPGIVAFATHLATPYPFHVHLFGGLFLLLALGGFIRGIKSKESWVLGMYVAFAIGLHLIVGYGLAAFQYDMYLYAGHYLFALFLLGGRFVAECRDGWARKTLIGVIVAFVLTTAVHNVFMHAETLRIVEAAYEELAAGRLPS